ncbi:hypothetical protein [Streptomyces sp. NPDC021356]|uniref:DUF7691 family protein n=1 Tax=Streptomyces sp. NPDC021356 TaxID=3154900 RepID=UPI0033F5B529
MSHHLEMSTGDMRQVVRLLTAVEPTPEQQRILAIVRERCEETDARLREDGIDSDVSVRQALDELMDSGFSKDMDPAYRRAFHAAVACHFSDPTDLGWWRRTSWFGHVDDELARHGVPSELRLMSFLFSGAPIPLPHPGDVAPSIGTLPAPRAAAVADAYEAVLPRLDEESADTVGRFAEVLRFEAEEWESARELGQNLDTIFFWLS